MIVFSFTFKGKNSLSFHLQNAVDLKNHRINLILVFLFLLATLICEKAGGKKKMKKGEGR